MCPRCGQKGFLRKNPYAVVHYHHPTRKTTRCYVKRSIEDRITAEDPPKEEWGESELYDKLGNMANHFRTIADDLEKVRTLVYKFKPDKQTSTECVSYLNMFDEQFLNVLEKLLIPYHDRRWATNWSHWIKIQLDNLKYGPRAAGMKNAIPTGQRVMQVSKDKESVIISTVVREFTSAQVKKKQAKTFKFAEELLASHPLEKALSNWANKPNRDGSLKSLKRE